MLGGSRVLKKQSEEPRAAQYLHATDLTQLIRLTRVATGSVAIFLWKCCDTCKYLLDCQPPEGFSSVVCSFKHSWPACSKHAC